MNALEMNAAILALSKHATGGIVGIIIGVVVVGIAVLRVAQRAAGAALLAFAGAVIVILGILLYTRAI